MSVLIQSIPDMMNINEPMVLHGLLSNDRKVTVLLVCVDIQAEYRRCMPGESNLAMRSLVGADLQPSTTHQHLGVGEHRIVCRVLPGAKNLHPPTLLKYSFEMLRIF